MSLRPWCDADHVDARRRPRHLRLTDAGVLLQRHARRILDDVGEAENAVAGLIGKPSGVLRVNAPFTFASGPLATMLPSFIESFPDVRVVLTVENRRVELQTEGADIAIRIGPLQDADLVARRLTTFELIPCASPQYLRGHPRITTPRDLRRHRLIAHADSVETWSLRTAFRMRLEESDHEAERLADPHVPVPAIALRLEARSRGE